MTGLGNASGAALTNERGSCRELTNSAGVRSACVLTLFRSAPAENAAPASSPVMMTHRTSGSVAHSAKTLGRPSVKSCPHAFRDSGRLRVNTPMRSEEHTSELQSLMRISYAVFCLKQKNAY